MDDARRPQMLTYSYFNYILAAFDKALTMENKMNIGILVVLIFLCVVSSSLEIASNKSIAILGIMLLTISTLLFSTRNPQVVPDTQAYIYVYDHIILSRNGLTY